MESHLSSVIAFSLPGGMEWVVILVIGLLLSVALMGVAANFIARYIERYRWIAYVGLVVILYVAIKMIWEGAHELIPIFT